MVITKPSRNKVPSRKFKIVVSIAILIAVAGCASKKLAPVVVSDSRSGRVEQAYLEDAQTYQGSSDSNVRILREDSAQQIFRDYGVNPTISTSTEQYSTFAMDVDTVSYRLAKASLESNRLPNTSSIRVEEFINNFSYNYASSDDLLSVSAEVVPSPYRPGFHLLHIGVKAKNIPDEQRLPANLVLVADVSGSMNSDDKMGLQKRALTTLVSQLGPRDSVAIVTYDDQARVLLKPTRAHRKTRIYAAIQKMKAGGSTNVEQGLQLGYAQAEKMAYPGHVNRVVLTSDGMANVGAVDPEGILQQIKTFRERNIFLTTVGVGRSMYNDYLLEQLANNGNGSYLYLANQQDIERVFVDGLTTQLQVVAKDAKVQLRFNSDRVSLFRQIGYENRELQTQDFLDASKDGGEIGANQQVTVLYEVKLTASNNSADLAEVSVSYKKPQGSQVLTLGKAIPSEVVRNHNTNASPDTVVSMAVAAFAEKLRQSYWSRAYEYTKILSQLSGLPMHVQQSMQVGELQDLVYRASQLDRRFDPYAERAPLSNIDYDRVPLLR